jgi:hypothetical protein
MDQAMVLPVASLAQDTIIPSTLLLAIRESVRWFGRSPW